MKKFLLILGFLFLGFFFTPKSVLAMYYTAVSPANGSTTPTLRPTFSWNTDNYDSNGSYTCMGIFEGANCSGSYLPGWAACPPSTTTKSYTFSSDLSGTHTYSWNVYGKFPSGSYSTSNCNTFYTPAGLTPPTITGTTISGGGQVSADGSTIYNISATASDNQGGTDIIQQFALVNYGGAARGLLGWDSRGGATLWGSTVSTILGNCALYTNAGTGYGYGNEYMTLMGCNSSTSGNNRTTTFSVKFSSSFVAPVTNTLYGSATDTTYPQVPWVAGSTFNLTATSCTSAMPSLSPPNSLGLVDWWRMEETAGYQVADSIGANDGYAKNTLYNNLVSYWKMDDLSGADSRGTNTGALSGQGCNFPVNSNYANNLPANLVSYWKLEDTTSLPAGSQIQIQASGTVCQGVYPAMQLVIDGITAQTWQNISTLETYTYTVPATTTASDVRVYFPNDCYNPPEDRNLTVNSIQIAGKKIPSTDPSVFYNVCGTTGYGGRNVLGCSNDYFKFSNNTTFADAMGNTPGSAPTPNTCNFSNSLDNNIISYWQMNETAGTIVADKKGSNNGTAIGCTFDSNPGLSSNLLGFWKLDETYGTTAFNSASNSYNGTISNATSINPAKVGAGRSFIQSDTSEITVPSTLGLSKTNVTMATWVYLDSTSKEGAFIKVGGEKDGFAIGVGCTDFNDTAQGSCYGNNLIVLFEYVRWINTGRAIGTGWHHVAVTIDGGGTPTVYLDGVSVGTFGGTAAYAPGSRGAASTWIGGYEVYQSALGTTFHRHPVAVLDEVGIWGRPLSGGEIAQLANYGNTGVSCGPSPSIVNGKINNGRSFNGSTDYISTPLNGFPASMTDITISFWANPTSTSNNNQTIFLMANADDIANRLNIHLPWGGNIYWDFGNINSGGRMSIWFNPAWLNTMAYWTFTAQSGVGMKIYRNGTLLATTTTSSTFTKGTKTLSLGAGSYSVYYWPGIMDEVGIWNRALSQAEITSLYGSGTNPAQCKDLLGPTAGKINNGQAFDGVYDYMNVNSVNPFRGNFTVATWVKFTAINRSLNDNTIIANGVISGNNTDNMLHLVERGSKFYFGFYNDDLAGNTSLSTGVWYHVAFVYDGGKKIYVNGNLDAQGGSGAYQSTALNTQIGHSPWAAAGNSNLAGALDEMGIWSRALSASEIANLYDKSGAQPPSVANPPACMPGPVVVPGKIGNGLAFGGNDKIAIPNPSGINTGNQKTVAAWIKTSTSNHNQQIFSTWDGTNGWQMYVGTNGQLALWTNSGGTLFSNTVVNDGNWHHVAAVFDGGSGTLFVDGVTKNSAARTFGSPTKDDQIGTECPGTGSTTCDSSFVGSIDEIAIWNRALSGPEINIVFTNGNSGISYDPAISGGPSITTGAYNSSQDTNNYPLLSGTTLVPGKGRNFNGATDYATVSSPVGLPTGSVMSVTAWVKPSGTYADGSYNGIVRFGPGNCNNTFLLALQSTGKPSFAAFCNDFVPTQGNVPAVTAGVWNHLAAVLNGASISLYVNGQKVSGTLGSTPNIASGVLNIGSTDNPGRFFNGAIDEVRVYKKALSDSEILEESSRKNVYPTGACGGTCDSGYFQPGYDRYCSPVNESCVPPGQETHIVGSVAGVPLNASGSQPIDVKVDITNNPSQSQFTIPGATYPKTYDFIVGKRSSYTLNIDASTIPSGYTTNPQNYQMAIACASSYTGPTFWYNSDAGSAIQSTFGQLLPLPYYGSGKVSQSGSNLGYRLESYSNDASIIKTGYGELYDAIARNSQLLNQDPCPIGGRKDLGNYSFFCYDDATSGSTSFETVLRNAISTGPNSPSVTVIMGNQATTWSSRLKTIGASPATPLPIPANKTVVAFVKGSLNTLQNITVNSSSGLVMVLDNANPSGGTDYKLAGNLYVDPAVTELSGFYVFPGAFNDIYTSNLNANTGLQLVGYGSLISTNSQPLGFGRNYDKALGPAEKWYYQPKYLSIYKNILATPRYTWKEIPPQ